MHILMLTWEYPPNIVGGISRVVYNLSKELESMGNKVTVFTCCESGWCEPEKDGGITVYRVNSYNLYRNSFTDWIMEMNFAMIEKAVSTGRSHKVDLIHAHDWLVAYAARVLKHSFSSRWFPQYTPLNAAAIMEYTMICKGISTA